MLISKELVWCHMPRAGGTIARKNLRRFGLEIFSDREDPQNKHNTPASVNLKHTFYVINIRRLPQFVSSHISFHPENLHKKQFLDNSVTIDAMLGKHYIKPAHMPDALLRHFQHTCVDFWIRQENIVTDLVGLARKLNISIDYIVGSNHYSNSRNLFTDDEVQILYRNNPTWADLEKELYK